MTRKTATNTFCDYLARKKYTHENCPHTFRSSYYFLVQLLFHKKLWETKLNCETTSQFSHQIIHLWMWIMENSPLVVSHHFLSRIQQKFLENMRDICRVVIRHIFSKENIFDFAIFTASSVKWVEARDMRNLSHEVTTAMWINFYTCYMFRMFSCSKPVSWTSRKSSVAGFRNKLYEVIIHHHP